MHVKTRRDFISFHCNSIPFTTIMVSQYVMGRSAEAAKDAVIPRPLRNLDVRGRQNMDISIEGFRNKVTIRDMKMEANAPQEQNAMRINI